jgi:protein TonB
LVEVLESSGHQVLDDAARESVRSARFQPARAGGAATNSWVEVPISFRLHRG